MEPRLVEASVLEAMRGDARQRQFQPEREAVYDIVDPEAREAAFVALHARWFERLELDRPFYDALAEQPAVARGCARWLVAGARTRRDEAADLLVAVGTRPTLLVRVLPGTVATRESLLSLLRRELLHAADMLDPGFGYDATLPRSLPGGPRERLARAHYRVLWDIYVDGRLVQSGGLPATVREERIAEFRRAFPHLGSRIEAAFDGFFGGRSLTHHEILAFAGAGPAGAAPSRCRLCQMPTRDLEPEPSALPGHILAAIRRDVPAWRPADGVCRRCAEVYACREAT